MGGAGMHFFESFGAGMARVSGLELDYILVYSMEDHIF
jgi:hypothetical protein